MAKNLTRSVEDIKQFSERPNVNKVVAEKFLMGISEGNVPATIERLVADAKTYKWNNETIEAILDGILTYSGLEIGNIIYAGNTGNTGGARNVGNVRNTDYTGNIGIDDNAGNNDSNIGNLQQEIKD